MASSHDATETVQAPRLPHQRAPSAPLAPLAHGRRKLAFLPVIAVAVDALALVLTVVLATVTRDHLTFLEATRGNYRPNVVQATPVIVVGWLSLVAMLGAYQLGTIGSGFNEYRRVFNSTFFMAAAATMVCFFLQFPLSRAFVGLIVVLGPLFLIIGRVALGYALGRFRKNGLLTQRVLVVGSAAHVDEIASVLEREYKRGFHVVGALTNTGSQERTATGVPVLGMAADTLEHTERLRPEVIVFAGGAVDSAARMREIAWGLEDSSVTLMMAPSVTDVAPERVVVRPVGGVPMLQLEKPRAAAAATWAKRLFDVLGSLVLLVLLSPMFAFIAYKIWRFDQLPILFRQERIGRYGEPFTCWKFRTMVTGAEALLPELHAELGVQQGVFAKIKDDPRVTPPGRWLRKTSLDELPQLVNVLTGHMSLVGPRPQVQDEVDQYDRVMSRRLDVRPGMTGLWQVSGRSDLSIEEAIRLDLYYVDNWSMIQDVSILARTFKAVVASSGAY